MKEKDVIKKNKNLKEMITPKPSREDPQGSYTGLPIVEGEVPVQDADDL